MRGTSAQLNIYVQRDIQIKCECQNKYHYFTLERAGADDTADGSVTFTKEINKPLLSECSNIKADFSDNDHAVILRGQFQM